MRAPLSTPSWCVVLSTGRCSASDFARHTFRLTPRVVRRLCVAAQRNPWAPRGRSRGPGDKRGAPARCLVLYRREPKRPKPVRDEAEAGRRTFSNICISRTSRVCIVAIALCLLSLSLFSACFCLFLPRQPSANFVLAKLPHWDVKVLLTLVLGVLASKKMLPWLLPLLLGLLPAQYFRLPHFCLFVSGVCFPEI